MESSTLVLWIPADTNDAVEGPSPKQNPSLQRRLVFLIAALVAFAFVVFANFIFLFTLGAGCSVENGLVEGSPRDGYCSLFEHPDDRVTFLIGFGLVLPTLATLVAAVVSTKEGQPAWLIRAVLGALSVWMLLLVPLYVLSN
jgi:hypothetical protein